MMLREHSAGKGEGPLPGLRKVRTAVIPVAGLGTRFLPITKSVPKELLPVLSRPTLHLICEEILSAGIRNVVLVSSPSKGALEDYISPKRVLREHLRKAGKDELLAGWKRSLGRLSFRVVYQRRPRGLGHAVLQAARAVKGAPFALLLPDEIFFHTPGEQTGLAKLVHLHEREGALATIAVKKVPAADVSRYGIVRPAGAARPGRPMLAAGMVEKPETRAAPSRYAIIGRYVIDPAVFGELRRARPGAGGEIQLTDALDSLCRKGKVLATEVPGVRFDTGVPLGLVKANLYAAWQNPRHRAELKALVHTLEKSARQGHR